VRGSTGEAPLLAAPRPVPGPTRARPSPPRRPPVACPPQHAHARRARVRIPLVLAVAGVLAAPTAPSPAGAQGPGAGVASERLAASHATWPDAPAPAQPTAVRAVPYGGQTFVTWAERAELAGERYRVYRHDAPIDAGNLDQARFLYEVAEDSSAFWADRWVCAPGCADPAQAWGPRFAERLPVPTGAGDVGSAVAEGTGILVWTLQPRDLALGAGSYHYAVTTVADGVENRADFGPENRSGAVAEAPAEPRPLEILDLFGGDGVRRHVYVQFLDLTRFNPTLNAPNAVQNDFGQDLSEPRIAGAVQYAFTYVVLEPLLPKPGSKLPVILKLHAYTGDTLLGPDVFLDASTSTLGFSHYTGDAIEIRPVDAGSTWWFGHAGPGVDFRAFTDRCEATEAIAASGAPVVNYTEERVLRMVHDLLNDPAVWQDRADPERVYVVGHSMGGGGAVALAQRYPNVFAGAYASAPVVDYARLVDPDEVCGDPVAGWPTDPNCMLGFQLDLLFDIAAKWGPPGDGVLDPVAHVYPGTCSFANPAGLVLPIEPRGPADWADHLAAFDGTHVWDWHDHTANLELLRGLEMAPLGVRHSSADRFVNWPLQGQPFYAAINAADRAWGGLVDDSLEHLFTWWYLGLPPALAPDVQGVPFAGLAAVKSETVPGMRLREATRGWILPPPSSGFYAYGTDFPGSAMGGGVEWSSSWDPWDGAPVDEPGLWRMSLRTLDGVPRTIDLTPRRLQAFAVEPGRAYRWTSALVDGTPVACGCVVADGDGLVTIEELVVDGAGRRVTLEPGPDPACLDCLLEPAVAPVPLGDRTE